MRHLRFDEANRAAAAPQFMAAMIGAACFGVSRVIEMPSDFAHLTLYVLFVGCAAMMLPQRGMWRTVYGPIGVLLAVTLFCVFAIPGRPLAFASVRGMHGFMLLIASALTVYAVLAYTCSVLLRLRLVSTDATHE